MLSTEFAVFEQLGFDTSETVADLYYALMAFNRLDEGAEIPYDVTPVRDGFFLRDDIGGDFLADTRGSFRFRGPMSTTLMAACYRIIIAVSSISPRPIYKSRPGHRFGMGPIFRLSLYPRDSGCRWDWTQSRSAGNGAPFGVKAQR